MRPDINPGNILRAAVVGYGAYGRLHAQKYLAHPRVRLAAIADRDPRRQREARAVLPGIVTVGNAAELEGIADIASVVVPASQHYTVARQLLDCGMHLLIEKPFTASLDEARALVAVADARGLLVQPGYLERFNLTLDLLRTRLPHPRYIEARRLARTHDRGTDVSVILDLMIHDIDMLLEIVAAPVTRIEARGVRVFSAHWDVANAQLHFANGCVANLTASRASLVPERRLHAFSDQACALADIDAGILLLHQRRDSGAGVMTEQRFCRREDPLAVEIDAFVQAVSTQGPTLVSPADGCRAMAVAERINAAMEQDANIVARIAAPLMNSERAIAYLLRQEHPGHG